jgi:flavin-dependent dehydrogenase
MRCDVVIVGARCAGAALATFLARHGVSVVVVDKSSLPSEHVLSTHTVHPSGMAVMDELGLGDAVRSHSPEMRSFRLDWHGGVLDLSLAQGHGEYCPRRERFDRLLQDAARQAGAQLLDRTTVRALIRQGERVCGVELEDRQGGRQEVRASIVVGADGRASRVAHWVGAEEQLGYDAPRGMYWGYFPAPAGWGCSARYPAGMYVRRDGPATRVAFHTDGDQLLLGALPLSDELPRFRADPLGALREALSVDPMLRDVVRADPAEPVRGYLGERYFVRRAAGPGWLLVGDAGIHKDFLSGDGMSEALIQARSASRTIAVALGATGRASEAAADYALTRFWRERDVQSVPLFFHAQDLGALDGPVALNRAVFRGIAARPELRERFIRSLSRELLPFEVVGPRFAIGCALREALAGSPSALSEFVARGKRVQAVMRDLAQRRRALAELEAAAQVALAPSVKCRSAET